MSNTEDDGDGYERSAPRCPNCGGETTVIAGVGTAARICETPGCRYPDGGNNE